MCQIALNVKTTLQDKATETLCSVKTNVTDLHVDAKAWLAGEQQSSFTTWRKNMPVKGNFYLAACTYHTLKVSLRQALFTVSDIHKFGMDL